MIISQPNNPPSAPIINGSTSGHQNTKYEFSALSFDEDNDTIQYIFYWGDGETTYSDFIQNGTPTTQLHNWTNYGEFQISVKAYDKSTESGFSQYTVLIDVLPIKNIIYGYLVDENSDGIYDFFNNTEDGTQGDVKKQADGSYLIDSDGNGKWNYKYDLNKNLTLYPLEEISEINTPIIIVISLSAILLALYIGLTENGKYKIFSLIASSIPLFTRIQKDEALDQEVRGKVYYYIETNPGAHYNNIMRNLKLSNGTISHHLKMLEKMDIVKSRREGIKYRAFYPMDKQLPETQEFHPTELQTEILEKIKQNIGIAQTELIKLFEKKQQTMNYNIKKLERNGLIKLKKEGGKTYCYLNSEE